MLMRQHDLAPPPLVVILIATLLCSGLIAPGIGALPKATFPVYSGEDLYRGILLADGPVAALIPEIREEIRPSLERGNPRLQQAVRLFQDQLMEALNQRHPEFFADFGEAMRSGDRLRIQETLLAAARTTLETLRASAAVKTVGRDLRADPNLVGDLLESMRANPGLEAISDAELLQAVESVVSLSVDDTGNAADNPYTVDTSIVAVLVTVAAIVAAITVVAASSFATVLNVAGAVNYYLAVVSTTSVYVTSGPRRIEPEGMDLLQEQLIDSIAVTFGS
jgi:hypothetical protein